MKRDNQIDLNKIKTYSLSARKSKVNRQDFARTQKKSDSFREFIGCLPKLLAANDFCNLIDDIVKAHKKRKPVIFMLGGHVIKCGLSPIIIDLMDRGIITCLALNGAGIIHDFEIAFGGSTSEDVAASVKDGSFGMARETAEFLNNAISRGANIGTGLGHSVGQAIGDSRLKFRNLSICYNAVKRQIPLTVFVAIGTDIIHQHPSFSGAATGELSMRDFHLLVKQVSKLGEGGVVINFGSSVILPEVFIKSLNLARNLGVKIRNFTTANFDMICHYRPSQNIVNRPTQDSGQGFYIIGHHELMLPLFYRSLIEKL